MVWKYHETGKTNIEIMISGEERHKVSHMLRRALRKENRERQKAGASVIGYTVAVAEDKETAADELRRARGWLEVGTAEGVEIIEI